MKRYVVGISGASGAILAIRLIEELANRKNEVEVIISPSGRKTLYYELGSQSFKALFSEQNLEYIHTHNIQAIESSLASGSSPVEATIIVPCSMATIAAISIGLADNLIRRVADVALKEKRPLILVPRETPLHTIHLENLLRLSKSGAIIFPPMPMWYFRPKSIEDLENALVGKILSYLNIASTLTQEWTNPDSLQASS
ncbi:Phenolic acid decarboxylase subunit B,aromatic acid decarboxylase,3-polyprenyl-4-hydroxybenzoate decarboxylase,polyprenyl P-hydroxybenzoate and phenylacrylic acid decarboxylases,Flavoprotein [Chlamydia serpentis]|uniref:Flavin prenyltransferase UbiX n=1 Tax=Chlamydia serpentis TaxID=1967782 RepID=A0A2R8FAF3_9CHLA|nr:flavin prenyltransferase UbiX [Chlamydia serpentis]SPN73410.1 Phenolic acid decarboxylase subunit B,aromatic acid decarboxylase,3-polyprenyl-4-hydroxybenzoate decarboxylase,polyprenyl P-hydroxybenzoate and phenylacrylic acid decarboxylases,Flavoprotein [Chlamydia serpentis]